MIQVFKLEGDFKRILKYLETNNKSNLHLMDSINYICRRPRVKRELAYYVLHILSVKASIIFKHESADKAMVIYQQVCHLYERWRTNRYQDGQTIIDGQHAKNIFGTEEYIQARAMYAECL
jgi:hypothetical protein